MYVWGGKSPKSLKQIAIFVFLSFTTLTFAQTGVFKVNGKSKAVQIGYTDYRYLTFGFGNLYNGDENGHWAIEHYKEYGGLNFWRPWPLWNSGNFYFFIHDFGHVGIGMYPNANDWTNMVQIKGKVRANGYNTWSDEKLKENISPLNNALEKIVQLKPVTYNYKTDVPYYKKPEITDGMDEMKSKSIENEDPTLHESFKDDIRIGFLAQDIEKVLPEVVETDNNGLKSVDYDDLIPVAIQAIKEQQEQIQKLQAELENIKALNSLVHTPEGLGIKAILYQNDPNPFNQSTTIAYNIESEFTTAELVIYDFWANIKSKHSIYETGQGSYTLQANTLEAGTYHYSLMVNGVIVDTRIMFLIK